MDEKGLGRRLQSARQAAGLTQQALCHKADLSYSTLTKIERGAIKAPSIFTIQSIADALGASLDDLIGRVHNHKAAPKRRLHSKNGVSFVYFDVNGCLVRSYHRAFASLAHDSGQAFDAVEASFWHYNDRVCRGDMSIIDFNRVLAKELGMGGVDWTKYYLEAVEPMPQVDELLKWAAKRYGVGLLTNIMPGQIDAMIARHLIPDVAYDALIDSSEVHAIKPEQKIYKIAIEHAKCRPQEILLIDDSRANLMAAEKLGMHVLWFDDVRPEESVEHIYTSLEPASAFRGTANPISAAEAFVPFRQFAD